MLERKRNGIAMLFLAPNIVGFAVFTLIPVIAAIALSLFEWNLFHPPKFVGLGNFINLLGWHKEKAGWVANDPEFWKYLGNTLFFMLAIPVNMAGSMFLAIVLNQKLRGRTFFRTIFFLPSICAGVAIMLLWKWLYNPEFGLINYLLARIGIDGPRWLEDYYWAKPAIMIMGTWAAVGGTNMILYLAGLQGIPPELYEAADIDGANSWQKFRYITYPALMPTTFFIFITSVIGGFQGGFEAAYVMTGGGPAGATTTVSYYIYNHAFQWFNMGYAAAIAVVLFVIVLIVTLINWKYGGRKVEYI